MAEWLDSANPSTAKSHVFRPVAAFLQHKQHGSRNHITRLPYFRNGKIPVCGDRPI